MEARGYKENEEEQLGGLLVYYNGEKKECISFSINKYYSKWQWR